MLNYPLTRSADYFDDFLANRQDTLFRSVHSLIYIFDVESPKFNTADLDYFDHCLAALRACSGQPVTPGGPHFQSSSEQQPQGPFVRVLIHKMDLVPPEEYDTVFDTKSSEIRKRCQNAGWGDQVQIYGTSIWNESLYKVSMIWGFQHYQRKGRPDRQKCATGLVTNRFLLHTQLRRPPVAFRIFRRHFISS